MVRVGNRVVGSVSFLVLVDGFILRCRCVPMWDGEYCKFLAIGLVTSVVFEFYVKVE